MALWKVQGTKGAVDGLALGELAEQPLVRGTGEKIEEVDTGVMRSERSEVIRGECPTGSFYVSTGRGHLRAGG